MSKGNGMDKTLQFLWETEGVLRQIDQRNRRTTTRYKDFADRILPMINHYTDVRAETVAMVELALDALVEGDNAMAARRLWRIHELQEGDNV